jgi:threonine dehydrogenase-like Zn-dependent dehydrogenase
MKALTFAGKETIEYSAVDDPFLAFATDVLVRVKCCAICGSDLHIYHEHEKGIDHHTVMGHEFTGEIVEAGKGVKNFRVGDHVISPFSTSCGRCYYCTIGLTSRCVQSQLFGWVENGIGVQGAQAEFVRVPLADGTLVKVPESINDEQALLLGDIIPTGFFCAKQAEIKSKNSYAVVGCGPVGLMAILGATQLGAEKIFAIDTLPERLAMAAAMGAIPIVANAESVSIIKDKTEGRGVDGVLEAVGNRGTGRLAYELVRPGGIISMVGVCNDEAMSFSPSEAYNKNITFKVGRCPARHLIHECINQVTSSRYDYTSIISHRLKLQQGPEGYRLFANKTDNCLKVILTPHS